MKITLLLARKMGFYVELAFTQIKFKELLEIILKMMNIFPFKKCQYLIVKDLQHHVVMMKVLSFMISLNSLKKLGFQEIY
jgi:hypothetical protein